MACLHVVAILIMAMMPDGPVLFVLKHVGKNGKLFDCETPTPNLGGVKISHYLSCSGKRFPLSPIGPMNSKRID